MIQDWLCFVLMLGLLSLLSSGASQAQDGGSIGQVTGLEGKVTVLPQGKFAPELLTLRRPVFREDIIETDRAAKVRITLTDATVISLGELSRLELKEFSQETRQQTRAGRFAMTLGVFRAILKEMMPPSTFEVTTPTAIAAIRGTELMGEVSPNSTAIVVLDGRVGVSNIRPNVPEQVVLSPGMGTTVTSGQSPSAPTRWSESRIEALRRATTLR
jgi:ferric-dicitrate binding protein FerR (iron transport regulator)